MSATIPLKFTPGGLNSDVVETELGIQEYTQMKNLRMSKHGELINDKGYLAVKSGLSGITSAIEIDDDVSGDRFIVYHSGTALYRLSYDDGDGNGYENESASVITLPSGVSFTANDDVRFHWHNHVLRIIGGSHPLRYEYFNRTMLPDAEELYAEDDFALTTESWNASANSSIARVSGGVPTFGGDAYDLQVTQTGADGYAWKGLILSDEGEYVFRCWVQGSGSGDKILMLGTSEYDDSLGSQTIEAADTEWRLIELRFTKVQSTLYVTFQPSDGQSGDVGHIDNLKLYQIMSKPKLNTWALSKAFVEDTQGLGDLDYWYVRDVMNLIPLTDFAELTLRGCNVLDRSQYSLFFDLELDDSASFNANTATQAVSAEILVDEKMFDDQDRMTAFGLAADAGLNDGDIISVKRVLGDVVDFTQSLDDVVYQHAGLGWELANPKQLKLIKVIEPDESVYYSQNGYLVPGNILHLENQYGWTDLMVVSVDTSGSFPNTTFIYVQVEGPITPLLGAGGASNEDLASTKITVKRRIEFDGSQYRYWAVLDKVNDSDYYDATGYPPGVSDITFDYHDLCMVGGRSFVLSNEIGEGDLVRFSPVNMPDVHPSTFYFQTEIGDSDANLAVIALGDRTVILKAKSLSKMSVYGDTMTSDIGFANRGLYATHGYIVIDGVLYFMDRNDVYLFNGVQVVPLLKNEKVRNFYKTYVDADSFFMYNKIENDLYLVLSGNDMLVYSFDFEVWRTVNYGAVVPVNWFLNSEKRLIAVRSGGFYDYNHDDNVFAGQMSVQFKTRLTDFGGGEQYKKLKRFVLTCKCSTDVNIKVDCLETGVTDTISITPDDEDVTTIEDVSSKLLVKNIEITVYTTAAYDFEMQFRSLLVEVMKWS